MPAKFSETEANERLCIIGEMINRAVITDPMLSDTERFLKKISAIAEGTEENIPAEPREQPLDRMIISCDASIKNNPGGPAAVAAIIQWPAHYNKLTVDKYNRISNAKTNNEAEFEAVYFGLQTVMSLHNNPKSLIEVRSDSKLVVGGLNKTMELHEERLKTMRDAIVEYVLQLPVPIVFRWFPRNSTPELTLANNTAQDLLQVPNH